MNFAGFFQTSKCCLYMEKWNQKGTKFLILSGSLQGKPVVTYIQLTLNIYLVNLWKCLIILFLFGKARCYCTILANSPLDTRCFKVGSHNSIIRASPLPQRNSILLGVGRGRWAERSYLGKSPKRPNIFDQAFCSLGSSTKKPKECARYPSTFFILHATDNDAIDILYQVSKASRNCLVLLCYALGLG